MSRTLEPANLSQSSGHCFQTAKTAGFQGAKKTMGETLAPIWMLKTPIWMLKTLSRAKFCQSTVPAVIPQPDLRGSGLTFHTRFPSEVHQEHLQPLPPRHWWLLLGAKRLWFWGQLFVENLDLSSKLIAIMVEWYRWGHFRGNDLIHGDTLKKGPILRLQYITSYFGYITLYQNFLCSAKNPVVYFILPSTMNYAVPFHLTI